MSSIGNKEIFARNLTYYVERCGKQQKEIAEVVGVATSTFNDWMKAKKYPRIGKIEKLAEYFGILKSDLIEDKSKKEKEESPQDILHQLSKIFGVTYDELMALGQDEKRQELISMAKSLSDEQLSLILRIAHSVVIEDK